MMDALLENLLAQFPVAALVAWIYYQYVRHLLDDIAYLRTCNERLVALMAKLEDTE
jgi:hypothetical protein